MDSRYCIADNAQPGQFLLDWDCVHVWEVLGHPSGGKILRCYATLPEKVARYKKGEHAISYFKERFILLQNKEIADGLLRKLASDEGTV